MSTPPLPARLAKLRDEAARAHNPWPQSGGMFDGEQMEKSFSAGFTAAAYLYQEEMARLVSALERHATHLDCDDCFYSCPASDSCCNEAAGKECNCGAQSAIDTLTAHARFLSGEERG